MSSFDTNDLKIQLNTILNRTKNQMEESEPLVKDVPEENDFTISEADFVEPESEEIQEKFLTDSSNTKIIKRPHTLEDLINNEELEVSNLQSTFEFNELDEDEEVWVMDIPRTIDPMLLKNQTIQLGDKSKLKVGEDRYCTIKKDPKSSLTCIFNSSDNSKEYKAVNVKPAGIINVRKKISGLSKKNLHFEQCVSVPYPPNVKIRHPFFGVEYNQIMINNEKKVLN